ncbi:uncharacterized protein [Euwallacea fornicatus]|uniref:uncharacterized protein n=1 Tax=Euwallacea fornicatus TaxID=995702 RepID=UPI00338ED977
MKPSPKISFNFLAILYVICFKSLSTNSRTSTLWKLNEDRTKIVEGELNDFTGNPVSDIEATKFPCTQDSVFNIIASTKCYKGTWIKYKTEGLCSECEGRKVGEGQKLKGNDTNLDIRIIQQKHSLENDHELSCGKPVNFTFYDNLVGVVNREKHPAIVEPEAMMEFIRRYKFKVGKTFDLGLIENKLRQIKREKPKSVSTLQQLGNFWRIKGDPRRAIECFRRALATSPHNAEILLNLAKVLFHLQYLDDAIYLTRRSLEVASPEKGAWQQYFTLGEIFKAYGHYQEAQVHFRHTLDLHPGYEPALKLLKELEEMPLSPWQSYTYFIIGILVVVVLLFLNNLDRRCDSGFSKSQKHSNKNIKGLPWSGKKCKKIAT